MSTSNPISQPLASPQQLPKPAYSLFELARKVENGNTYLKTLGIVQSHEVVSQNQDQQPKPSNLQPKPTTLTTNLQPPLCRYLIALPLSPSFNPMVGSFSRDHIQTGDKISLPNEYFLRVATGGDGIVGGGEMGGMMEVPWMVRVERVDGGRKGEEDGDIGFGGATSFRPEIFTNMRYEMGGITPRHNVLPPPPPPKASNYNNTKTSTDADSPINQYQAAYLSSSKNLTKLTTSILDFRSPKNHVFLPNWMFWSLGLRPGEVVKTTLLPRKDYIPQASLVRLRPHSSQFLLIDDHVSVMEENMKHYSLINVDTVISFVYDEMEYFFDVVEVYGITDGLTPPPPLENELSKLASTIDFSLHSISQEIKPREYPTS